MSTPPPAPPERRARRRTTGRRTAARRKIDTTIASPCISVCQFDNATNECLGCRRTIDEIRDWIIMTAEEKLAVLARIAELETEPGKGT